MYKCAMDLLSTKEVAERLGVSVQRVQALVKAGRLPAQMIGGTYIIKESDLKLVEDRKPGRPRKQAKKPKGEKKSKSKG